MSAQNGTISTGEAAELLGVSMRQVQRLVSSGSLTVAETVGRVQLIDAESVQRLSRQGLRRGRPWSMTTVAAVIDLLAEGKTERVSTVQRTRLRERLAGLSAEDLVRAMRCRADVRRFRAAESFLGRVREGVAATGATAIDNDAALAREFGLAQGARVAVDGYVDNSSAISLIRRCHLSADAHGNVTLRLTDLGSLLETNPVTVALDLSESLDSRERRAGLDYLRKRLKELS